MNVFDKFLLSREVVIKEGKITMDNQRIIIFPVNFIGLYSMRLKDSPEKSRELYECMKRGMTEFSKPVGKEYLLTSKDFLDRWVKYCAFGGWGIVEYRLLENDGRTGYLHIRNMPMHMYLKKKGVKEPSDALFEGLIAGSASGTFRMDIDVLETKCICSGNDVCVYDWGKREYLMEKFPEIAAKRFGDKK